MQFIVLLSILTALTLTSSCAAYRILAVFPFNGKSHNIVLEAVMKSLAKRGHQVDVVTHFPLKKPLKNYNDIINLHGTLPSTVNNYTFDFVVSTLRGDLVNTITHLYGNRICHQLLGHQGIQRLIKNPPTDVPYDLVITEAFTANCFFGLGYVFKVPVISVSSAVEYPWISDFTGNDDNPVYVPNALINIVGKLNFWDRLKNFFVNFWERRKYHALTAESQTEAMRKYLDPNIPDIRVVEKNVALTLVNSDPIIFGVKPVVPTLVQIAGIHVEENDETLPPDLKKWMDDSKDGVVFFTLGSMVLIETLPVKQLKELYASFEKIAPTRVLMKIVDDTKLPPGLPKNVKTLPWIPQIPALAHPNLKVLINHGGLGGLIEALYFGVPMIGIPLFSDQFRNCEIFVDKKMMVPLDIKNLAGKELDSALQAVLHDPVYKKNAVHYSNLFRDKPLKASESTAFWVEYIIRNGQILRSPALDYTWWELAMLDVYASFFLAFILSFAIVLFAIQLIFKVMFKVFFKQSSSTKRKKNKTQ